VLPPHHVGGFGVAARAFAAGCGFREFGKRWEPRACRDWLEEHQITHTSLVPTQVHDLVAAGLQAPDSPRAIVVGGGHLDARTGQAARSLGWPVLASYGMTEAASQIATQPPGAVYQPSPIPVLPIWRCETLPDQTLRIAGPALFSGVLAHENGTWIFQPRQSEWHQTQDRAELANGMLAPLGRADHRVKVLGELVDPEEIERELIDLSEGGLQPGAFAVIAVPDERAEHALVPVFDAATGGIPAAALTIYAERAPGFRRLRPPVMLAAFPRGPLGKPRRAEIAALLAAMD
jgi:O-succinylbenzoic acid--CoA ligase